jgi:hypothetical protein
LLALAVILRRDLRLAERRENCEFAARLTASLPLTLGMGVVTYYYALEVETGETDEPPGTVSIYYPYIPRARAHS